jgi:hypothetical protein
MKIAVRLSVPGCACAASAALMRDVLVATERLAVCELQKNAGASAVRADVSSPGYLKLEYALHPGARIDLPSNAKHTSLPDLLASSSEFDCEQGSAAVAAIRDVYAQLQPEFSRLIAARRQARWANSRHDVRAARARLTDRRRAEKEWQTRELV